MKKYIEYYGISKKELSSLTGINYQAIARAIQRDSEPSFTDGIKICKCLNVPFDYFLDDKISIDGIIKPETDAEVTRQLNLYKSHAKLIEVYDKLPVSLQQKSFQITQIMAEDGESYSPEKK